MAVPALPARRASPQLHGRSLQVWRPFPRRALLRSMGVTVQRNGLFGLVALGGLVLPAPAVRADDARAPAEPSASTAAAPPAPTVSAASRPSPKPGRGGIEAGAPEFETLADGSTRLSIVFSQSVA